MLVSINVLASFQNEFDFAYLNSKQKEIDTDAYGIRYLHLFSPVEDSLVPYDAQLFLSRSDELSVGLIRSYDENSADSVSDEEKSNAYLLAGEYNFKETAFYAGISYLSIDSDSGLGSEEAESDYLNLNIGYYLNSMAEIELLIGDFEREYSTYTIKGQSLGITYEQLFNVNERYFSLVVSLRERRADYGGIASSIPDAKSREFITKFSYYINKSTSIYAGVDLTFDDDEDNSQLYLLGISHYFNQNYFASIDFMDSDDLDLEAYRFEVGYRF